MSSSAAGRFLSGKVLVQRLPSFQLPLPAQMPEQRRLALPQGELAQLNSQEPFRYLAFLELIEGTIRGNHYHKSKKEFVYVGSGKLTLAVEDMASGERASIPLAAGDLAIIETGVAHAMKIEASGFGVEFSPTAFDPSDTYRHPLVSA